MWTHNIHAQTISPQSSFKVLTLTNMTFIFKDENMFMIQIFINDTLILILNAVLVHVMEYFYIEVCLIPSTKTVEYLKVDF